MLTAMALLAVVKLTEELRNQVTKIIRVMVRVMGGKQRNAIASKRRRNLQEAFGSLMKSDGRDSGG